MKRKSNKDAANRRCIRMDRKGRVSREARNAAGMAAAWEYHLNRKD